MLHFTFVHVFARVYQWKNFENRSVIGEDMDKSEVPHFLAYPVSVQKTCLYIGLQQYQNV